MNLKGIVDLKGYVEKDFQPLDILGTTSYSALARIIWSQTWRKGKWFNWFIPYIQRAHLSTHIAVTVLGRDGRKWIMEMDGTSLQDRYLNELDNVLIDKLDWDCLSPEDQALYRKVKINTGLMLRPFEKYITENVKNDHVCWIGRSLGIQDEAVLHAANELMFMYYHAGVEYDYKDLFSFPKFLKKLKLHGTEEVFICSELPQRVFQQLGIIRNVSQAMSPMDWQINRTISRTIKECKI